jgi:hypothetical protein
VNTSSTRSDEHSLVIGLQQQLAASGFYSVRKFPKAFPALVFGVFARVNLFNCRDHASPNLTQLQFR